MRFRLMRTTISCLVFVPFIALAGLSPRTAQAAVNANMYVVQLTHMIVGSTATLQVRVNTSGNKVNAVSSIFTYPTDILSFSSIDTSSSDFDITALNSGGSGTVRVDRGSDVSGGITGDLEVANVTFNVIADGPVTIAVQNSSTLLDASSNTNDLGTLTNGQFATVVPVYRFYIQQTYEHFWTTDLNERNSLISRGYQYEGIAWYSSTDTTKQPVYRLYAPSIRQHLLTIDANEKNVLSSSGGWTYEGINEYVSTTVNANPVYRLYAPSLGVHLLTTDSNERSVLTASGGWRDEGVAWYQPF